MPKEPDPAAFSDFVLLLISAAPKLGLPLEAVLRSAGLPPEALCRRGVPIPLSAARYVWSSAERVSSDPVLGLRVAEALDVGALDILDYLSRSSASFGAALARFIRFAPLLADSGVLSLHADGGRAHFRHVSPNGVPAVSELLASMTVLRARAFSGEYVRPLAVRFRHHRNDRQCSAGAYERIFDAPVEFDAPCDELVFRREHLEVPFGSADPRLCEILEESAHLRLQQPSRVAAPPPAAPSGFIDEVRHVLRECIAEGNPNVDHVAERMGVSPRTLQRQLREQGTSHRALLAETRVALMDRYLASANPSRHMLAAELGYVSARSASRALRRR
ncbi:AraC family transcriptional regulator ligand-binding domain-containing protein [Sorangium sp. So ce1389]|uniref:AraC family transcriptional regulator ligand-binding domain-containing protein n=1 Tax=Sorangium sp. So ce1389 TaxID=3133336 RepID=UPI003F5F4763